MPKFTSTEFQLDFLGKGLNLVEENAWFNDQFFTKYSFPVEFDITKELDIALGSITNINAVRGKRLFEGFLEIFGREHQAVLIIDKIQGLKAQGKLRYGFEEFPNYEKKLSELGLEKFPIANSINDFALTIIDKTFPEVNYNFPQIKIDSLDIDSLQWQYFDGVMNNYAAGAFLVNEYNAGTEEQINRNLMQPVPYLLHVLQQGFLNAGLVLTGDILEDPEFKEATLCVVSNFYSSAGDALVEETLLANEYIEEYEFLDVVRFFKSIPITSPGKYRVTGIVYLRGYEADNYLSLYFGGKNIIDVEESFRGYEQASYSVDYEIELPYGAPPKNLNFASKQLPYALIDNERQDPEAYVMDLNITKIAGFDANGNLIPALVAPKLIDLNQCVPDITFGELLKTVKNWKNYDISVSEGSVEMNLIKNKKDTGAIVDLSSKEVENPLRNFFEDMSFILKFKEIESDVYSFNSLFVDANGTKSTSFVANEETKEILINGIPLPVVQVGDVQTAHLFVDDKELIALARYNGLVNGLNVCQNFDALLIQSIYNSTYREWLNFRIFAEGFEWDFLVNELLASRIQRDSVLSAYNREFIVKRVSKKNVYNKLWAITLECHGEI